MRPACARDARTTSWQQRFPGANPPALHATTQEEASQITQRRGSGLKRGVNRQSFAIYPKIAAVDAMLRDSTRLQRCVYEVHPEVSFCAWNEGRPMESRKKSRLGKADRWRLIEARYGAPAATAREAIRNQFSRAEVGDDDLHDAFAGLWTAERIITGTALSLPSQPPLDSAELPMRIVY